MRRAAALALLVSLAAACGPKRAPVVVAPGEPHYPDFLFPAPAASAPAADQAGQREAWDALQMGNLGTAERELETLVKRAPRNAALVASLGYVALARHDFERAVTWFDQALALDPALVAALAGRGLALAQAGRAPEAITSLEAAQKADPTLNLSPRIEALRFRAVEDAVSRARAEASAGKLDDARREYQAALIASPESALLLRELAAVERRAGQSSEAQAHLEQALRADPADRVARVQLADLLDAGGDTQGAISALEAAQTIERTAEVDARLTALRERLDLAGLPEQFRAIGQAATVTRADVAALIGIRLPGLLRAAPPHQAPLVTDAAGTWAAPWIAAVLRAGLMEPFANHTFQPNALVRRDALAGIISRLLSLAATLDPPHASKWQHERVSFADLPSTHPAFEAASRAVGAKVLDSGPGGVFEPGRAVTGAEAAEAVARLERLVGPRARGERRM